MLRFQCIGAHYTTIHAGAKTDVIFISRQRFYVMPIFSPFFLCLAYRLSRRGRGRWRAICSCPFFFLLRVLFICSTLLCFPPSFSARMRTQWQSDSMCLFSFFLKSSVALVYVFTTSVGKRYPTTGPLLSFFLFCYMCLLMWVFALFMRVFFFVNMSFTKNNEREKKKKNLNYIIKVFPLFICLTLLFFFPSFFFTFHMNWLADTYYFPHRYCWQMDIYTIFSLLRSETLNFHARTPPSFMWEGKRGLFFVCARLPDFSTRRRTERTERKSKLKVHYRSIVFLSKKNVRLAFLSCRLRVFERERVQRFNPLFFLLAALLFFFYCSAICLATPAAFFLCFFGFLLFVLVLYLFTWLLSLIVEGAVFNDFFLSLLSFAT